ncbi:hypothetical protein ARALYDRAFT_327516 [Arabidopsis lyrata subsp. lyrata]|uniref:Uncharacterized protein n=1 Tax=Arabidopsis lyrata subsp. lyrata TaxID=81972 RepID=D7M3C4_ARALL|nr:hypothetical protein ARALYDRAFT_327516 [Arabidopsis lyrata subsp. lyrata]
MAMLVKMPVKYFMVDAFTDSAFKGNPAVVCFLDDESKRDDVWLQSLATKFNLPMTCFLITITGSNPPRFILRWFTRFMVICGHATLASAHILFSNGLVGSADTVEFFTQIELNLPMIRRCEYNSNDVSMFSKALNGATIVDVRGTTTASTIPEALNGVAKAASTDKIIVVLPYWESVIELQPRVGDIMKCLGKVMIVTAAAPQGSPFDFCNSVCGSAHCSLAHYSSLKMNKSDFVAYAVHYDKDKQRVSLARKVVTVMNGSILV